MKKLLAYPYLFSLTVSFLLAGCAWKLGYIDLSGNTPQPSTENMVTEETPPSVVSEIPIPEITDIETSEPEDLKEETESEFTTFYEADRSYFDDALFIGDSRTVGLYEYGNLGNAIALADSGMSVYKIFKQSFSVGSGQKMTLEELLTQREFGKIYVMLGINELGYDFDQTVGRFQSMVNNIQTLQPDALIFLQANLHITEKKSASSPIYNNENINRFNQEVEKLADSRKLFYLDVNELFDDENGNLSVEYTVDESHVLGKYYADWVDWILKHAIITTPEHLQGTSD